MDFDLMLLYSFIYCLNLVIRLSKMMLEQFGFNDPIKDHSMFLPELLISS
jgi:hypothetical protein